MVAIPFLKRRQQVLKRLVVWVAGRVSTPGMLTALQSFQRNDTPPSSAAMSRRFEMARRWCCSIAGCARDGHTILVTTNSVVTKPTYYKKVLYDPFGGPRSRGAKRASPVMVFDKPIAA
jgi:hypothetical protein